METARTTKNAKMIEKKTRNASDDAGENGDDGGGSCCGCGFRGDENGDHDDDDSDSGSGFCCVHDWDFREVQSEEPPEP